MDCLDDWFKYDPGVVVIYDKIQSLEQEAKVVETKVTKKEIKEHYQKAIKNLEEIVKNCEDKEDMRVVAKALEFM